MFCATPFSDFVASPTHNPTLTATLSMPLPLTAPLSMTLPWTPVRNN